MSGEARPITAPALQLSTSSRLRSSDQIRTIIYNFAGDTGHQQEATSTIMEQTARARAGEHFTWWTFRQVKMLQMTFCTLFDLVK